MTKHTEGQKNIKDNLSLIVVAALETLNICKTDGNIINACMMSINNIVFIEVGLFLIKNVEFEEFPKADTLKAVTSIFSSDTENTLIASLNVICRLIQKDAEFKAYVKKAGFTELKTKLDFLKYHKNKSVQILVEDAYFLLD